MALIEKIGNKEQRPSVAILLFDNAQVIDYAGPWEVFGEAGFKVFTVAEKRAPDARAGHQVSSAAETILHGLFSFVRGARCVLRVV
jgi:putative intracellular protease/amidase